MTIDNVVSIIRDVKPEDAVEIAKILSEEGITSIEVSLSNEEKGFACLKELHDKFGSSIHLGAGTIIKAEHLQKVRASGASYVFTPGWNRSIVLEAMKIGLEIWPGVFSPGEIAEGVELGLKNFKLFPVNSLNKEFIKALKGPFPDISLMAVGGVNSSNIPYYRDLGIKKFGVGSELVPRGATEDDYGKIKSSARKYKNFL